MSNFVGFHPVCYFKKQPRCLVLQRNKDNLEFYHLFGYHIYKLISFNLSRFVKDKARTEVLMHGDGLVHRFIRNSRGIPDVKWSTPLTDPDPDFVVRELFHGTQNCHCFSSLGRTIKHFSVPLKYVVGNKIHCLDRFRQ